MKRSSLGFEKLAVVAVLLAATMTASAATAPAAGTTDLTAKVRHELLMLPYYGVFDDINFQIDNGTVTLTGAVNRPVLKSDAGNVVKRIEGVHQVVNQLEVLPLSPYDNRIRLSVLRAIYGFAPLQRYGWPVNPSIHIIVRNGNVTLEGVVDNKTDKDLASLKANGVAGVFAVTNNLRVEHGKA